MIKIKRFENNKFKTNEIAVFVTIKQTQENATKNALIPAVLRRGSTNYRNQLEISKKLENMYGANFNCGVDKSGDYIILKFFIETINNEYSDSKENLAQEAFNLLTDIVFNPLVENEQFNNEFVKQEKDNLAKIINSKKDDKANYAYQRCIEEMFKNDPYGIYKFGSLEDLEKVDEKNLYEYYLNIIQNSPIYIYFNGKNANSIKIDENINKNFKTAFNNNTNEHYENNENDESNRTDNKDNNINDRKINEINTIKEKLDVTQGKLIIGMNVQSKNKYAVTMYNTILGGGANSKLFQNVREKASLAYYASSRYIRRKDAIIIRTGIELANYDKAVNVIKEQIEEMRKGNISDFELSSARTLILSSLKLIPESQEDIMAFDFDQDIFNENLTFEQYYKKIEEVTLDEIIEVAKQIKLNTIYYLEK
jgi:predicted Zn-dependent peptidase